MGRLEIEMEPAIQWYLHKSLIYTNLSRSSNYQEDLQTYSNDIIREFIEGKLIYLPKSQRVIDYLIIVSGELLDSFICADYILIFETPAIQ